jgi:D-alanyl-lipoteichoic acid acyltransferase DltB (MBOAT superfamily)
MQGVPVVLGLALYVGLGRALVHRPPGAARDVLFAALNLAAVYLLFYRVGALAPAAAFLAYVALAIAQLAALRWSERGPAWAARLAFGLPIAALVVAKTLPLVFDDLVVPGGLTFGALVGTAIGISYLAFRTSYLALEVRNGRAPMPTVWQYLAFAFFAPTMAVGPINRYEGFRHALDRAGAAAPPPGRAALRVLVGAVKYRVLGGMLAQLTYSGLLLDGHPHHWLDLVVAGVAYYLYLYCNFSGFVDMAIGVAGLLGIPVEENFANPFAARNVRDFWNRWHITLSVYMRDVVFTPLSKALTMRWGLPRADHAIAVAIFVVFVLIGLWHGLGAHFVLFGVMHGTGVVATHYYTAWLKRRLGRERFAAYNRSRAIRAVAVTATFAFVTASFFLFANDFEQMAAIFAALDGAPS